MFSQLFGEFLTKKKVITREVLEEVLKHLRTMRDTWKEVMAKAAGGNNAAVS